MFKFGERIYFLTDFNYELPLKVIGFKDSFVQLVTDEGGVVLVSPEHLARRFGEQFVTENFSKNSFENFYDENS